MCKLGTGVKMVFRVLAGEEASLLWKAGEFTAQRFSSEQLV
jgi:hypothetical protein